ncbi:unnamed protein product [Arabidopsis thaliana]|uniref:Cysteine/Histidine-rich C1 domain family protein n=1 Tax=Arabidopsis thaliana TaxID=3702 RepID=A0A654FL27_ARATH|nr:unnamed protein product [Arabidopsis thaliana]
MATIAKPAIFSSTRAVAIGPPNISSIHLTPVTLFSFYVNQVIHVTVTYVASPSRVYPIIVRSVTSTCICIVPSIHHHKLLTFSETHHHKLNLDKEPDQIDCVDECGKLSYEFSYKCHECELHFHVDCAWRPSESNLPLEVNHPYHALHPLKLLTVRLPDYSDGKCRLCGSKIDDRLFYHCSSCNFTLDLSCILKPPQPSLLNLKAHDHQLTLLPRLDSFTCNACGLKGDRSPYVCFQCGFMIHQDCLGLPRLININRHDHRVARTSVLGVVNSVCGRCPDYIAHSKCATREDVWNGKELEGVPEEIEDIEPYVGMHLSHLSPILLRLCDACRRLSNGFRYQHGYLTFDVRCGSISEPFVHPSHPDHPLYSISEDEEFKICNGCKKNRYDVLRCIEDDCRFVLCFKCATRPYVVKHRVDNHPLSLCYGEKASDKFWCDICEKETNPETWFYTCKDHRASLHAKCVLGKFLGLMPKTTLELWNRSYEVVLNNSVSRPFCSWCELRCIFPIILKRLGTSQKYFCSIYCTAGDVLASGVSL